MFSYKLLIFCLCLPLIFSCGNPNTMDHPLKEMEFVLVDSITFDEQQILRILDYDDRLGMYLMVNRGLEGKYSLMDKEGNQIAENMLSEGPDAFGMVLHRAGFVGDEVLFISDQQAFVYDLNLKQLRKFPFEQDAKVRLIHWTLDCLSTYDWDGKSFAVANLHDAPLPVYPQDYYDTLNLLHLINPGDGSVAKGGKLDESSKMIPGSFLPGRDKPVFFSRPGSSYVSVIFAGDDILYQFDPGDNFRIANKIQMNRMGPDQLKAVPLADAALEGNRETEVNNRKFAGNFYNMMGHRDDFILAYRTGSDPTAAPKMQDPGTKGEITFKTYYYPFKDNKLIGSPILWDKPGDLILGIGPNRYLQYADQADIHDYEKDYQCYYIYELREKE
ncbi:MAG TPA: hypothetical protein VKZ51_08950 [Cyclobacteriaceae bacterium]|nr:hypothetical protein [Cyclobacteriaceae bacterium]